VVNCVECFRKVKGNHDRTVRWAFLIETCGDVGGKVDQGSGSGVMRSETVLMVCGG